MLVNFNVERLDKLLYDFYRLTGLTVSIWDAEFRQISHQPKEMCGFCRLVRATPAGEARCLASDMEVCRRSCTEGGAVTHLCHAGLVDTAIPITFKDSVMGYMMFGQVREAGKAPAAALAEVAAALAIDPAALHREYEALAPFDSERTAAAAAILKAATRYLWLSRYIEIGYHTVASQIDEYINAHVSRPITVRELCEQFFISKNRLYALSHEWFHMPIGDYIIAARIRAAKHLLATTSLSVGEVGAAVGIADHNYFTKFFKDHTGMPPLRYRKAARLGDG